MRIESRFLAAPLSLLVWVSYVLIVILWTPLVFFYRLATRHSDPDRYRVGRLLRHAAVLAIRVNPFWDFRVYDDVHPDARRPYLFVANHRSLADVFLVALFPWEMKFLSKRSVFRIPLLGWQMRVAGDIPLERGDRESAKQAIEAVRDRLARRLSVIVFPEGTRSADGTLGVFREGAFRLAIEMQVDVVPLAIAGTEMALPKHALVFQKTAATATVLPPVSVAGLRSEDAPRLAERVRGEIARAIAPVAREAAR